MQCNPLIMDSRGPKGRVHYTRVSILKDERNYAQLNKKKFFIVKEKYVYMYENIIFEKSRLFYFVQSVFLKNCSAE